MPSSFCEQGAAEADLSPADLAELVGIARSAAELGGRVLMEHYGNLSSIRDKGRLGDLVTSADTAAEEQVLEVLLSSTPEIGVLAEESGSRGEQHGLRWCVGSL